MRNGVLVCALLVATVADASANGRPPGTSTINFRQGNEQHIAAGMTFGLLLSDDGGTTWRWVCEAAVKYGGIYDPDYVYTSTGALFATTFDGSLVNRDGCVFQATVHGPKAMSAIAQGPDGAVYTATVHPADPATSDPGDNAIYKSTDNGMTFPVSAAPGMVGDWWNSMEVAPGDPNRLYLSGYRLTQTGRDFFLYKSTDGAVSWTPIPTTGIATTKNSDIDILGISTLNPDHVYVRVTFEDEMQLSDALYRSTNGGLSWTRLRGGMDRISLVVRANGDLVLGTQLSGSFVSRSPSNGNTWELLANAPHINCLVENAAGEVWACTKNYGTPELPGDDAGIMKSTDLLTWTKVIAYQDIPAPLTCPGGTVQRDECEPMWCGLKRQLNISSTVIGCPDLFFDGPPDANNPVVDPKPKGCCDAGGSAPPYAAFGLGVVVLLAVRRPRRSKSRR